MLSYAGSPDCWGFIPDILEFLPYNKKHFKVNKTELKNIIERNAFLDT